jgi:hypothetical protein
MLHCRASSVFGGMTQLLLIFVPFNPWAKLSCPFGPDDRLSDTSE